MPMSYVIVILVIFLKVFLPGAAFAHMAGQPPFFKVNGVYSALYPVPTTSIADFPLPQDLGPENYLVGKPIDFEIDTNQLPVPSDIVQKTAFSWDFGDGGSGSGFKNSHIYTKQGSYILTIHAQYDQVSGKALFQSVLLNVLPSSDYQLPQANILVNGKTSNDPLVDVLKFPYGSQLTFDAGGTSAASSKIVSYFWDFGDGQSANEIKVIHTYLKDLPQQQVFPVLRVKDENGFIADSFLEIDDTKGAGGVNLVSSDSKTKAFMVLGLGVALFVGVGVLAYRKK